MTSRKLTPAQVTLLRAVAEGHVDRLGACAYYATIDGRHRQVTERVRTLDEAGLINPFGVAIKHGKPMSPDERFPTITRSPSRLRGNTPSLRCGPDAQLPTGRQRQAQDRKRLNSL